jgi:O-acetyl-ADP-ribose deacetylase
MDRIYLLPHDRVIRLSEGDITRIPADAIVNAANSSLAGGGGVDGAIHRAGGPAIMAELDQLRVLTGRLHAGRAVATSAGNLPARWVFHAVGPVFRDGLSGEPEALASCYRVCLEMAGERHCRLISFPAISTGVYHFPFDAAASIAVREVKTFLNSRASSVQEVILVQFGLEAFSRYQALLDASGD